MKRHQRYVTAVHDYNRAARVFGLTQLPYDLPAYIARNPEHLQELVEAVEAALRPLQALLADMQAALAEDGQETGFEAFA